MHLENGGGPGKPDDDLTEDSAIPSAPQLKRRLEERGKVDWIALENDVYICALIAETARLGGNRSDIAGVLTQSIGHEISVKSFRARIETSGKRMRAKYLEYLEEKFSGLGGNSGVRNAMYLIAHEYMRTNNPEILWRYDTTARAFAADLLERGITPQRIQRAISIDFELEEDMAPHTIWNLIKDRARATRKKNPTLSRSESIKGARETLIADLRNKPTPLSPDGLGRGKSAADDLLKEVEVEAHVSPGSWQRNRFARALVAEMLEQPQVSRRAIAETLTHYLGFTVSESLMHKLDPKLSKSEVVETLRIGCTKKHLDAAKRDTLLAIGINGRLNRFTGDRQEELSRAWQRIRDAKNRDNNPLFSPLTDTIAKGKSQPEHPFLRKFVTFSTQTPATLTIILRDRPDPGKETSETVAAFGELQANLRASCQDARENLPFGILEACKKVGGIRNIVLVEYKGGKLKPLEPAVQLP